jgi:S-adenosylmethionine hydrolase
MKAVILTICPDATIIDISHNIRKFDVRMGAFILAQAASYFPEGTVHTAVVDPGVGTKRRPIIVETKHSLHVGPDNGLLILSAEREGISHVYEIANAEYLPKTVSKTFHGRDIFSPTAAHLAGGVLPSDFGLEIFDAVTPSFSKPNVHKGEIRGEVIHLDGFGNVITNVTFGYLKTIGVKEGTNLLLGIKNKEFSLRLCLSYSEVPRKTPLAIIGSSSFLEVAVNQGDASRVINVETGDTLAIEPKQQ